jgi:polyphosphate kinase 2 (PPK2 family)
MPDLRARSLRWHNTSANRFAHNEVHHWREGWFLPFERLCMFESAELGHKIGKAEYRAAIPALRMALQEAQVAIYEAKIPVILLISGQDGAGKGEIIHSLYEWLDPRFINTLAFSDPSDEERERPAMWRYWRSLPPKGRIGIFAGSWYSRVISEQVNGDLALQAMDAQADQINRFEAMLTNEGALVLKFWLHLTEDAQRARLKKLEEDPKTAWRVTKWHWNRLKTLDKLHDTARHLLRMTNTARAPWVVVDGADDRYRTLTIGQTLLSALQQRLAQGANTSPPAAPFARADVDGRNVLSEMDLTLKLPEKQYKSELAQWQGRLNELINSPKFSKAAQWCVHLKGLTLQAKAVPSGASVPPWMPGSTRCFRWQRPPKKNAPSLTCGAFGVTYRAGAEFPFLTVPGMAGCWSSESRVFASPKSGCGLTPKSTTLSTNSATRAVSWSSSGCRSARRNNCVASRSAKKLRSSASRSPRRTGATARSGRPTSRRSATWWSAPARATRPWTLVEANDKSYARVKVIRTLCERIEAEFAAAEAPQKPAKPGKSGKTPKNGGKSD